MAADGGGEKFGVCRGRAARSDGRVGQRRWVTFTASLAFNGCAVRSIHTQPTRGIKAQHVGYI